MRLMKVDLERFKGGQRILNKRLKCWQLQAFIILVIKIKLIFYFLFFQSIERVNLTVYLKKMRQNIY